MNYLTEQHKDSCPQCWNEGQSLQAPDCKNWEKYVLPVTFRGGCQFCGSYGGYCKHYVVSSGMWHSLVSKMDTDVSGEPATAKLKQVFFYSQDWGCSFISKADIYLPNYTALYAIIQYGLIFQAVHSTCITYIHTYIHRKLHETGNEAGLLQILSVAFVLETHGLRS